MATDRRLLPSFMNTDAEFRAWGSGIAAQLAACGLVQTSDTGQINWASVAIPAAGSVGGYEIWRFNDALQATKPIFLKVEYGRAGASNTSMLYLTVGTTTNGSGTLGGQTFARFNLTGSNTLSAGVLIPSYCSGDGGRIALCNNLNDGNTTYHRAFIVDRTRDATGAATDDGFLVWASAAAAAGQCGVVPNTGSIPTVITHAPANPLAGVVSKAGLEVALAPWRAYLGKALTILAAVTYVDGDLGRYAPFEATFLGATRIFMPLGTTIRTDNLAHGAVAGRSLAMLWE